MSKMSHVDVSASSDSIKASDNLIYIDYFNNWISVACLHAKQLALTFLHQRLRSPYLPWWRTCCHRSICTPDGDTIKPLVWCLGYLMFFDKLCRPSTEPKPYVASLQAAFSFTKHIIFICGNRIVLIKRWKRRHTSNSGLKVKRKVSPVP